MGDGICPCLGFQSRVMNASSAGGLALSWLAALATFGLLALLGSDFADGFVLLAALDFVGFALEAAVAAVRLAEVSRSRFMIERES